MKKSIFEMLQCCSVAVLRGVGKKTIFCLIFLSISTKVRIFIKYLFYISSNNHMHFSAFL